MSSISLNCKLLCASEVAEEITPDLQHLPARSFKPKPCYYNPIGYRESPTLIIGGSDQIDAATMGITKDGEVILAFRGTLPPAWNAPSILDWLQDFMAMPVTVAGLPGKVHTGFHDAIFAIWEPLLAAVKTQTTGGAPLIITGHSKGAAMASIAAYMLHNAGITAQNVIPIASPNPGDADFAAGFAKVFSQVRYTNHLDLVPFLPPTPALAATFEALPDIGWLFKDAAKWNYAPVGEGIYIKSDGTTIDHATHPIEYDAAIVEDLTEIAATLGTGGLITVATAHTLMCGHGYMNGICQDSVCKSPDCPPGNESVLPRNKIAI